MEKKQDGLNEVRNETGPGLPSGNPRLFWYGTILIGGSILYGWAGLFICLLLAVSRGRFWTFLGWGIYAVSWITYGLGFLLAGKAGVVYIRNMFRRRFKKNK